nr:capsid triplex subunit 1 UL38 [Psittacid alphaherpesvirus 6]
MRIQPPPDSAIPSGGASAQGVRRTGVAYASNRDPLRGVFRSLGDPIHAGMGRRTNFGFPTVGSTRANLQTAAKILGTVALPGPSTFRLGVDSSDWGRIAGTLTSTLTAGRGGLLDLGDATAGAQQTFLSRQVTLTDFCQPDSELPGSVLLSIRHPVDINALAIQSTPAGRDCRTVDVAWYELSEVAAVAVNRIENGGVRASLVSLSFLAASRSSEYPDRCAAEALRAHVIGSCGGRRRVNERLDRFGACLTAMVRTRAFPHKLFALFGGLLSWTAQPEIASVTAVVSGPQEGVKTDMTHMPRSSVNVPACVFIDLDDELKLTAMDRGFSVIYILFIYCQKLGHEGCRVHVVRSRLPETSFKTALDLLYTRVRVSNTITGLEGATIPRPVPEAVLPLLRLYEDSKRPTATRSRNIGGGDPKPFGQDRGTDTTNTGDGKYVWRPDARNRPTPDSCMYGAFCRLGYTDDISTAQRRTERHGSFDVPFVFLSGVSWNVGTWQECF